MAGAAPEDRGDLELRVVVRPPLQAPEDRAADSRDSDLKARKPVSPDNPDRADSRDSAPNPLPKSANAS